jgi:hypothetical protein
MRGVVRSRAHTHTLSLSLQIDPGMCENPMYKTSILVKIWGTREFFRLTFF